MQLTPPATADQLRQARRSLLETGEVPQGVVSESVSQSWQRSHMAGLSPTDPPMVSPATSPSELRRALAVEHDLLAHARPIMEFVFDQMRHSGSMVILADGKGLLLHCLGDADFLARADRVSLTPGALWCEESRGTNAIGATLSSGQPTVIHGAEHYLERNSFLTCSAAPVMAPDGRLRAVLDISVDQSGYHPHTSALVRAAARMIEDRLFHMRHATDQLLRFHPHVEGLGSVGEGLLAVTEDGWVMGANAIAQQWFGLSSEQIGTITLDRILGPQALRLQSLPATGQPTRITTMQGQNLFVRDEPERRRRVWAATPMSPVGQRGNSPMPPGAGRRGARADHLRDDKRLAQALSRAMRVQAQGIPVLLQGESGTGKEVFARTLHAEGDRASKPFVTLNCSAMPAALIEAELFGYVGGAFPGCRPEGSPGRIRQADGGTFFLDEVSELPMALQTRVLRALQDKQVLPLGSLHAEPVDFALVSATNKPLRDEVAAGRFRDDLYRHLNGLLVQLPALRERGDTADLIDDMMRSLALDMKREDTPTVTEEVVDALLQHPWPGNLRQLHAVLRTACALMGPHETELHWEHFSEDLWYDIFSRSYQDDTLVAERVDAPAPLALAGPTEINLKRLSHSAIERAIQASDGNMSEAARKLGISRNTLYRRLKQTEA